jgi:hypothetical protein
LKPGNRGHAAVPIPAGETWQMRFAFLGVASSPEEVF